MRQKAGEEPGNEASSEACYQSLPLYVELPQMEQSSRKTFNYSLGDHTVMKLTSSHAI